MTENETQEKRGSNYQIMVGHRILLLLQNALFTYVITFVIFVLVALKL